VGNLKVLVDVPSFLHVGNLKVRLSVVTIKQENRRVQFICSEAAARDLSRDRDDSLDSDTGLTLLEWRFKMEVQAAAALSRPPSSIPRVPDLFTCVA
jgi:hypothetical protein